MSKESLHCYAIRSLLIRSLWIKDGPIVYNTKRYKLIGQKKKKTQRDINSCMFKEHFFANSIKPYTKGSTQWKNIVITTILFLFYTKPQARDVKKKKLPNHQIDPWQNLWIVKDKISLQTWIFHNFIVSRTRTTKHNRFCMLRNSAYIG